MESIMNRLANKKEWDRFLENRIALGHLNQYEQEELKQFIDNEGYLEIAEKLIHNTYQFSIPKLSKISKGGTSRKRIIYQYNKDEMWILKLIGFLMHKYEYHFSDACYSFRRNQNATDAIKNILEKKGIEQKYCLKIDIKNYFNSIPIKELCDMLSEAVKDDLPLLRCLCSILNQNVAVDAESGELIYGSRGAMAGTPISPFLANIYLKDVDEYFVRTKVDYYRYADDILIFANSYDEILWLKDVLLKQLEKKKLTVNEKKFIISKPYESWEYLGMKYHNGIVDISDNTKKKIKAKIKRKANSLYKWKKKKHTTFEQTAFVLIRIFNAKFYDVKETGEFCWSKWFFLMINTDQSLKEIDAYLVKYIRYLSTGRHYKGNYKISYEQIKELGYRSLVNEFYKNKTIKRTGKVE